jgi:hypothetical protein
MTATEADTCRSPHLTGSTSYRYGCRCERCVSAKIEQRNASAERRARGEPRPIGATEPPRSCEICGDTFAPKSRAPHRVNLAALYARVCSACRAPYLESISRHRLPCDLALRLIRARSCEICGDVPTSTHQRRPRLVVDHDHSCCPATYSCGRCVRGFICHECNVMLGTIERIEIAAVERYLRQGHL